MILNAVRICVLSLRTKIMLANTAGVNWIIYRRRGIGKGRVVVAIMIVVYCVPRSSVVSIIRPAGTLTDYKTYHLKCYFEWQVPLQLDRRQKKEERPPPQWETTTTLHRHRHRHCPSVELDFGTSWSRNGGKLMKIGEGGKGTGVFRDRHGLYQVVKNC